MVAISMPTQNVDQIVDILQTTDPNQRVVVYYAVAESMISYFLVHGGIGDNKTENQLKLNKFIDKVCEIAILDRALFTSIVNKVYSYHMHKLAPVDFKQNLIGYTCLNDVLGVSEFYHHDDIFLINRNFTTYKAALLAAVKAMDEIYGENAPQE